MQLLYRPKIIDEAAAASMTKKKIEKGKKPGLPFILEAVVAIALFIFTIIGQSIGYSILRLPWDMRLKNIHFNGETVFGLNESNYLTLAQLLSTVIVTIIIVAFCRLIQNRKPRTVGFVKKGAVKNYLAGLLLGTVMFVTAIGICALTGSITIEYAGGFNPLIIAVLFLGWMLQGNEEEVVCRGYMLVSSSRRYHVIVGLIFNSILFGCMHLLNSGIAPLAFVNLVLFGVLMSLIFLKTGNIWLVSALHTSWNFVQGNVFGVLVSGGDMGDTILRTTSDYSKTLINGGDFGLEGGLGVTIVLVIVIAAFLVIKPTKTATEG